MIIRLARLGAQKPSLQGGSDVWSFKPSLCWSKESLVLVSVMQRHGRIYFLVSAGKPLALNAAKLNQGLVCFVLVSSSVWRPGIGGLEDMHWENSLRPVQSRGCRYECKHCPGAALIALVNNKPAKCYVYLLVCGENRGFRQSGKMWGRCAEIKETVCFRSDFFKEGFMDSGGKCRCPLLY